MSEITEVDVIDLDNDGLDDRLHSGGEAHSVHDVLKRVDSLNVEKLPEDFLLKMQTNMQAEMDEMVELAKKYERTVHSEILKGNYHIVAETRKHLRLLKREFDQLLENQESLKAQIQNKRLETKLTEKLGKQGLWAMRGVSIVLTILVLSIMFIDLSYPPQEGWLNPWNIFYIDSACCVFFLWEFAVQYQCADNKRWFLKRHMIDLITAIPIPPADASIIIRFGRIFRLARLFRLFRLLRILRVLKTFVIFSRTIRQMQDLTDLKTMQRSFWMALSIIFVGGLLIGQLEPPSDVGITTMTESMWWSFSTVVTGGFADLYNPVSVGGQILTSLLIISGMILIGVFTATLTTVYMGDDTSDLEKRQLEMMKEIQELKKQLENVQNS